MPILELLVVLGFWLKKVALELTNNVLLLAIDPYCFKILNVSSLTFSTKLSLKFPSSPCVLDSRGLN